MFFLVVFAVVLDLIIRQVYSKLYSKSEGYILMGELLVISFFMTLCTVLLINLIDKVFGSEFVDEKL